MRAPRTCGIVFLWALAGASASRAVPPPFAGLTTITIAGADVDVSVPDAGALTSLVTVTDAPGVVVDVDVTIDLAHPQPDQLDVWLVAPSGRTVTLTTDNGGGNDDVFAGATFDDQAAGAPSAPNVRNFPYANGVATGPIQPEEALGALVGEAANGPWALVVVDDGGGQVGMLHGWSLTLSTVSSLQASEPVEVSGAGGAIPDNQPAGRVATITVAGAGSRLLDLDLMVDVAHPNAADLDLFLTAPSGRRIDVATDLGGGNDDLWAGTAFDDQAGAPASDTPLPPSGTPFARVAGEGALAAFLGEDPNGTWTLTAVDDTGGNTGTLRGWSLRVVTATTVCGDGVVGAGETCDDGNALDGDGCDRNCTPTGCGNGVISADEDCDDGNRVDGDGCPAGCRTSESSCDDCADDDGNGLVDLADPACAADALTLRSGVIAPRKLRLVGALAVAPAPGSSAGVLVASGGGVLCAELGALRARGRTLVARGTAAGGSVSLTVSPGRGTVTVTGRGLSRPPFDGADVLLGVRLGADYFAGTAPFRTVGRRRVRP